MRRLASHLCCALRFVSRAPPPLQLHEKPAPHVHPAVPTLSKMVQSQCCGRCWVRNQRPSCGEDRILHRWSVVLLNPQMPPSM